MFEVVYPDPLHIALDVWRHDYPISVDNPTRETVSDSSTLQFIRKEGIHQIDVQHLFG